MAKKGSITYTQDKESTIPRALKKVYIPTAEFYSQVIDSLLDYAVFTIDDELIINSWNAGATGIFQFEPDEILGKPFHTIFSDIDIADGIPEKEVELSITEGRATDNRWHICKDGKRFFAHGLVFPLTGSDGEPLGFVKILRDITEMKKKEDAIDIHVKELETLNAHKESVISILSHDLRSPLAGFISLIDYTKTNLAEIDQAELKSILEILHSSAITELEQLDHLVEWGRIQYASETFFPAQTNLYQASKKVMSLLIENVIAKKINVIIDIPFDYIVFADAKMIHSILQNLISNAIKFSHIEGAITVTVIRQENRSVIAVKDTGIGITPEILDQLFTPSLTALSSRRSNNSSAGIGLLLSKHLVEKHKGEIWADSKEGAGASFFFSLPDQSTVSSEDQASQKDGMVKHRINTTFK